ncbi:hypothetical protein FRB95_005485 [Tulasnella sp. JGI-2019a]|nr:hypothetical protein FRB93_000040 [Tulasnella sp. JGI-2019a]KAG9029321.1 hypothetical protein FRB95_005485 [Tulasnella sp. JGI-2019a]
MLATTLVFGLSLIPTLVSAGLFPAKGPVKILTASKFKQVMKEEQTSMVVFFAPWCGHCKNLTPEYIKAAQALDPLVPFYAVDCDADENKQLCAEQGVKGFPTLKSFPRGGKTPPHDFQGERKAGPIVNYMNSEVPNRVAVIKGKDKLQPWLETDNNKPHALLLTSKPKTPLQWKVLQNKFRNAITFAALKDADGAIAKTFDIDSNGGKESVILVWNVDATEPVVYKGEKKFEPLVDFLSQADVTKDRKATREEL